MVAKQGYAPDKTLESFLLVFEIKEETGYHRAALPAQPLNGAMPKVAPLSAEKSAENWAKGNLTTVSKTSFDPATLKRELPELGVPQKTQEPPQPRSTAPQQDAARNDRQTTQDISVKTDPVQPVSAAPFTKAPLTLVPPKYTPIVAAGVLSTLHRDEAALNDPDGPDSYRQGDEFKIKASSIELRRRRELEERSLEADGPNDTRKKDDFLLRHMAEQQRQAFMQSLEYATALNTVNHTMRGQERAMDALRARIADLDTRYGQQKQDLHKIETKETTVTEERKDLVSLKETRDEHTADEENVERIHDSNVKTHQTAEQMRDAALHIEGDNVIMTVMEEGKSVKYSVGEDGVSQKLADGGAKPLFDSDTTIFSSKDAKGNIAYVNMYGHEVSTEQKTKIDKALQAQGVTAGDVLPDYGAFRKEHEAALAEAEDKSYGDLDLMDAQDKEEESRKRLESEAARMNIPMDKLQNLENMIDAKDQDLKKLLAEKQELLKDMGKTQEERNLAENDLKEIEAKYQKNKEFEERLKKGEFRNEQEMLDAMPEEMKEQYQANKPAQSPAVAAENTSRVNGSAAASMDDMDGQITAGADKQPTSPFNSAASGIASKPETPAPKPDADYTMAPPKVRDPLMAATL